MVTLTLRTPLRVIKYAAVKDSLEDFDPAAGDFEMEPPKEWID